ncbi:cytochrome c oxidase assembly protein [Erythrobacter sp. T5W1-R]|uniref:cytochrome c oxidase assembly protein n=1 Tax=Erythrobacter sp. T5W1-R TaxID=3101752 RepID=UPI002AFF14FD|nr:cytochrome c oxidase assembly protein [Erythrobacter sp. T5W1-R]MEA1618125.1 cytochrome c oxidase assembly protein [Erythrobacter sp. T5W1-R]
MASQPAPLHDDMTRRNARVGLMAAAGALAMLGLGYAAVPLYQMFCQVTGFGGTTMKATEDDAARAAAVATGQKISVRFDASTSAGMPWIFKPTDATQTVTIGQRDIATYTARNDGSEPITGVATFNVTPEQAGKYFNKIQCFCFTEQTLAPGQEITMPVLYYVDPAMLDDPNMAGVQQITLSYTFHRAKEPQLAALDSTN